MFLARLRTGLAGALAAGLMCAPSASAQFARPALEAPPGVLASAVVPAALLRSPHYTVRDEVAVRENAYVFRVDSDIGFFETNSVALLDVRLREIATLAQAVSAFNQSNRRLGAELRGVLTVRGEGVTEILASPLRTASSLASQLGRNIGETIGVTEPARVPLGVRERAAVDQGDPVAAAHRRTVASQLRLDVYSRNPKVQEFLAAVVRARESGRVGAGFAMVRTPGVDAVRVDGGRIDAQVRDVLRQLGAAEIDEAVRDELLGMGVSPSAVQLFVSNGALSPRHRLIVAAHLAYIGSVPQRGLLVETAARADSEPDALAFQELTRMYASYHERVEPLKSFTRLAGLPAAATPSRWVLCVPVDLVHWDAAAARLADALRAASEERAAPAAPLMIVLGDITETARRGFASAGVETRAQFLRN